MGAAHFPGAVNKYYPIGNRALQSRIDKLVLHSTETSGLPSYTVKGIAGYSAPVLTLDPWNRRIWQHFPSVAYTSKTLRDTGGFAENRDNVSQIEIIGYSDPNRKGTGKFLPNLPEAGLRYIAEAIAWFHREWGVPLVTPAAWPAYPRSYGKTSARMSTTQYDRYRGVLGHLHVPDNLHGDPTINITRIMAIANTIVSGTAPIVVPKEDEMNADQDRKLSEIHDMLLGRVPMPAWGEGQSTSVRECWGAAKELEMAKTSEGPQRVDDLVGKIYDTLNALSARVAALDERIAGLE